MRKVSDKEDLMLCFRVHADVAVGCARHVSCQTVARACRVRTCSSSEAPVEASSAAYSEDVPTWPYRRPRIQILRMRKSTACCRSKRRQRTLSAVVTRASACERNATWSGWARWCMTTGDANSTGRMLFVHFYRTNVPNYSLLYRRSSLWKWQCLKDIMLGAYGFLLMLAIWMMTYECQYTWHSSANQKGALK